MRLSAKVAAPAALALVSETGGWKINGVVTKPDPGVSA